MSEVSTKTVGDPACNAQPERADNAVESGISVYELRPPRDGFVFDGTTSRRKIPMGWEFLARGSAFVTRRVKNSGPFWILKGLHNRRGGYTPVYGIYAPAANIAAARALASDTKGRREEARGKARKQRAKKEVAYELQFRDACLRYLDFAPQYEELAGTIASNATERACEKHSGRVGRSGTLELEQKAELAVRAQLRHEHTRYDDVLQLAEETELASYEEIRQSAHECVDEFLFRHRVRS